MRDVTRRSRQLALDLTDRPRWGGRRAGAGRKPAPNPRQPRRKRPPLAARFACHVTLKARRDVSSLRTVRFVRDFERSLREVRDRIRLRVVHYALQPDHAHFIVEAWSREDLAAGMKSLGARLARAANRVFRRRGPVLADRYHLHILRSPCSPPRDRLRAPER
jgi:REP element-mobilizing transposase RayT